MTKFNDGDKVRTKTRVSADIPPDMLATVVKTPNSREVAVVFDNPRGIYAGESGLSRLTDGVAYHCWLHIDSLELVGSSAPSVEKMIPASKVREIAAVYAARHGWCDEVNNALREMGAQDDTLVEVTYTHTRTVQLRRSDLDKLVTTNDLNSAQSANDKRDQLFRGRSAPTDVTFSSKWEASEPVEVEQDPEWVSANARSLREGEEVRFAPGEARLTYNGRHIADDVTMRLTTSQPDSDGDMRVRFSRRIDGVYDYGYVSRSKLQVNRRLG